MADQFSALELLLEDGSLDDATKRQAMGAQLRRQNAMGIVGQLMGVQPTQMAGQNLQGGAENSLKLAMQQRTVAKEAAARESERKQAQANWQAQQEREARRDAEQQRQFAQQEARLGRQSAEGNKKRYDIDPNSGRIFDTFTGEFVTGAPGEGAASDASGLPESGLRVTPQGGKPPSESEAKTGMRTGVGVSALTQLAGVPESAMTPGKAESAAQFFGLPAAQQTAVAGFFGGPERLLARGAQDQFIDQALTEMTGAAYTEHQLSAFRSAFMPSVFDNEKSRAEKQQRAYEYVRQQAQASGRAWTPERDMAFRQMMQAMQSNPQSNTEQSQPQGEDPRRGAPGDKYLEGF